MGVLEVCVEKGGGGGGVTHMRVLEGVRTCIITNF